MLLLKSQDLEFQNTMRFLSFVLLDNVQFIVQQLDDGVLKSNVKFTLIAATTPGSTDTVELFVVTSKVGTQVVQQIGSGALKVNIM